MIRVMTPADLQLVLSWAADEGWNPGLDDAAAFLASDPEGFLLKEVNGVPAAAISVVNHSDEFAFLGLYICAPEFRGQGYGMEVWQAGLTHAGDRCIGLDGVPAQQENYAKSGFQLAGVTTRLQGILQSEGRERFNQMQADWRTLSTSDAHFNGAARPRFCKAWFSDTDTRQTFVISPECYATARKCKTGIKIGPLHAQDTAQLEALIAAIAKRFPNEQVLIDVPSVSNHLIAYLDMHGFEPVFETARMYKGTAPAPNLLPYTGSATLELG